MPRKPSAKKVLPAYRQIMAPARQFERHSPRPAALVPVELPEPLLEEPESLIMPAPEALGQESEQVCLRPDRCRDCAR